MVAFGRHSALPAPIFGWVASASHGVNKIVWRGASSFIGRGSLPAMDGEFPK